MVQDVVDGWWWTSLMMFGPLDTDSPNSGQSMAWGTKRDSNDVLRRRRVDMTVPPAAALGVTLPDPELALDPDTGRYRFGPIDWTEVKRGLTGGGAGHAETAARPPAPPRA